MRGALNKIKGYAEEKNVTVNLELLNSKVNHKDYMADHSAWGVELMKRVNSPKVKLLYDIYHMQIMEGDLIRTIRENIDFIGHFHTGGNPGRHELDDTQEVNWHAVANAIADTGYRGFFSHEFIPVRTPPIKSLEQAYQICSVLAACGRSSETRRAIRALAIDLVGLIWSASVRQWAFRSDKRFNALQAAATREVIKSPTRLLRGSDSGSTPGKSYTSSRSPEFQVERSQPE